MSKGDHRMVVGIGLTIVSTFLACAASPSPAVREWFASAYTPAMQHIMDPDLAPWSPAATAARDGGAGPARPRPSPEDMRAGCAEGLRRLDGWREVLEAAPDDALATAMRAFVRDQRGWLRTCAATGVGPGEPATLDPVIDRLGRLGVRLPEG